MYFKSQHISVALIWLHIHPWINHCGQQNANLWLVPLELIPHPWVKDEATVTWSNLKKKSGNCYWGKGEGIYFLAPSQPTTAMAPRKLTGASFYHSASKSSLSLSLLPITFLRSEESGTMRLERVLLESGKGVYSSKHIYCFPTVSRAPCQVLGTGTEQQRHGWWP